MCHRIKKLRKTLGLTQQRFSERLGISRNNIATYETGKSNPGESAIALICREFGVNETWLRTGSGEMFIQKAKDEEITRFVEDALSGESADFKRRLISTLSRLEESDWDVLERLALSLAEKPPATAQTPVPPQQSAHDKSKEADAEKIIELPSFLQPASAGHGNWLEAADEITIRVPDTPTTRRADFAIRVSGHSMEPRYADGDLVFVRRQESVEIGEHGIWIVDGCAYIKQRGDDRLISINPDFPDITPTESTYCVGKVIGKL